MHEIKAGLFSLSVLLANSSAFAQLSSGPHYLDTDGYLRTGIGASEGGAPQAEFQAPGAQAKYRLGNEANTYYELAFDYRYRFGDPEAEETPYFQLYYMGADFKAFDEDDDGLRLDITAQLYARLANIRPGLGIWVGRRYYDRRDIHLNDHFWLSTGQGADFSGGIEGIDLGVGKLNLAAFRFDDIKAPGGALDSYSVDVRLAEVAVNPTGFLTFWTQWVHREGNHQGFEDKDGFAIGAWHDQAGFFGDVSTNTLSLTFRHGPAVPQGTGNPTPVREDQGFDLDDAYALEITNNFLIEPNLDFSLQWAVVLRKEDRGVRGLGGDSIDWYSTGVRPIYYFTDHLNVAFEVGLDYVDNEIIDAEGSLLKTTLALQLAKNRGYYSRPVLRLFGTYATWSDAFRGLIGNSPGDAPYGDDTSGWTIGAQVEAWW